MTRFLAGGGPWGSRSSLISRVIGPVSDRGRFWTKKRPELPAPTFRTRPRVWISPPSTLGSLHYTWIAPCFMPSALCCARISPRSTLSSACLVRISPNSALGTRTGRELLRARHLYAWCRAWMPPYLTPSAPYRPRISPYPILSVPRRTWIAPRSTLSALRCSPIAR